MFRPGPEDRTLKQRQKNEVLAVLRSAGLEASEFAWMVKESRNFSGLGISVLEHRNSRYFYQFDYAANEYEGVEPFSYYSPGEDDRQQTSSVLDWAGRLVTVGEWANSLADELDQPDLWALGSGAEGLRVPWTGEPVNTSFSPDERQQISRDLAEVLQYVRETHSLNQEQLVMLDARFAYLEAATQRLGRYDWRGLAFTTIVTVAVDLALGSEGARALLERFGQILSGVLRALPQLGP